MTRLHPDERRALLLMIVVAGGILLAGAALANGSHGPQLPPGVTCADVRKHVRDYGITLALAWARVQGLSAQQIKEIRRACNV